jgi:hypothetical protein
VDDDVTPAAQPPGRPGRPGRPGAGSRALLGAALGLAVVAAVAVTGLAARGDVDLDWLRPRAYVEVAGEAVAIPDPPPSSGRPLPPVPVTTQGAHAFLHTTPDGGPVGYDPCRPVPYVLRTEGMPPEGERLVTEAVAVVSAASGLLLEYRGTTDEEPAVERVLIQPERYGDGWAPVLVAWSDESVLPELAGEVAGVGGSAAVPGPDGRGRWLAAGRVVLDAVDVAAMLEREDGYAQARAIVVHELAHVLGLDHVDDPGELMHPVNSTRTDLGPGDLQGLALVGQVACVE